MSVEQDIFNAVRAALEADATLSNYVEKVYDGLRSYDDSFVPKDIKNYIILEPLSCEESYPVGGESLPASHAIEKHLTVVIGIVGVITALTDEKFSYVTSNTGQENVKGILELDEDIKNAIDVSDAIQALSDAAVLNVTTQSFIFETFPKRKVSLALTIKRSIVKGLR